MTTIAFFSELSKEYSSKFNMHNPARIIEIDPNLSEDSRERLIVLSELKNKWNSALEEWRRINSIFINPTTLYPEDEVLLYNIIIGTFPLVSDSEYENRLTSYMLNTHFKKHISVDGVNNEYFQKQFIQYIENIFNPNHVYFSSLSKFLDEIVDYGIINSLTELTIKMTSPILDEFQKNNTSFDFNPPTDKNNESTDINQLNLSAKTFSGRKDRIPFINELWNTRRNSEIKHWLHKILSEQRMQQNELFLHGEYLPLKVRGIKNENILAYARYLDSHYFITVVPLNLYSISEKETYVDWGNTTLELPIQSDWMNPIDEKIYINKMEIKISELFKNFPVACLKIS